MKYRYLSIFLLILVLSLGAVSAQEDTASDDSIALVQDNEILSASEYIIDDSNYDSYFDNETGAILENSNISDGDTIKLGNVSDKEFVIDKLLTITSNSSSDVLTNVSFYFNSGSDNSTISNLNFISYDAQTSTISIDNASNIAISENIIDIEGAENAGDIFAIFASYADNLNVQANVISYTGKTNGTAFNYAIYVLGSEDVEVKENVVEIEIPAGDLDWATGLGTSEGIVFAACDNLAFTDNNITLITNESVGLYPSVYVVHVASSDNVAVEGNKIEALSEIDYLYGVKVDGEGFSVSDNVINVGSTANYACGVEVGNPSSGVVDGNNISVIAPVSAYAVYAADWYGSGCSVNISNNKIEGLANTFFGVSLFGVNEAVVEGNTFEAMGNYTTGVASDSKVLIVNDNVFTLNGSNVGDPLGYDSLGVDNVAINAKGGKVALSYNDITSTGKGLVVIESNLTAERNTIHVNDTGLADSYAIYLANDTDVLIMNNGIHFVGKTIGTTINNAMYAENSTVDSISENYFGIDIPSVDVPWREIPATSGNSVSFPVSEGIVFRDMTGLEFADNTIDLTATDVVTVAGYDTIYVVDVKSDMAAIDGNTIIANGKDYIYGIISTGRAFITNNQITLNSELNYACGIDIEFGSSGAVDGNVIDLFAPYVAYGIYAWYNYEYSDEIEYTNNDISINSYAGYAMNLYGSEALIDGNKIYMEGNYTMGISAMMDDIATITNNEIYVLGSENDTKNVGDMIPAQTVGIIAMSESQIHNNVINSNGNFTIVSTDDYSEITDNYLVSAELLGDDSVSDTSGDALVENNIPIANATNYNLTNDTFFLFFNEDGFIRENITSESLTFIGEFSNLPPWMIIDRPVKLLSDNAVLGDMSFNIMSDNVTVDGFMFVSEELSEIIHVEDAVNVSIINNNIIVDGVADENNKVISIIMSDDVLIDNNNITFGVETNDTLQNIAIHASGSDNLVITRNTVAALLPARSIDWGTGMVYSQGVFLDDCDNAVLYQNIIGVKSNDQISTYDTIYAVNIKGDNATLVENEIGVVEAPYGYALVLSGENFDISDNMIFAGQNGTYACAVEIDGASDGLIEGNLIYATADVSAYGIYTANWAGDVQANITDNMIIANANSAFAMSLSGSEISVENNGIIVQGNYTTGIVTAANDTVIDNNTIIANGSNVGTPLGYDMMGVQTIGVKVVGIDATVTNNNVTSNSKYAVEIQKDGTVTDNELYAEVLTGDFAVDYAQDGGVLVVNNTPEMELDYKLTNDTFYIYFDDDGVLREQITGDNLTFIGEFSNLVPTITINKPITLLSDNATLNDIAMSIVSDNVTVDGFNFIGKSKLGVYEFDNAQIINNNFDLEGANDTDNFPIEIVLSENTIIDNNTIVYSVETDGTFINYVIYAEGCDNLTISNNDIAADLPARSINWTTNTVYSEGVSLFNCDNAVLDNNTIDINANDQMSTYDTVYAVNIRGNNAIVTNNGIAITDAPYGYGLVITGEYFEIDDNMIIADNDDYSCGIDVESNSNGIIADNIIVVNGTSAYGIYTANWAGDVKAEIADNVIVAEGNTVFGMSLSGSEAIVGNNIIELDGNYTTGIASAIANITIEGNTINATGSNEGTPAGYDSMGIETTGVHIVRGNATVTDNNITTTGEFAVDAKGTGSVTDNYLVAAAYTGDAAVDLIVGDTLVANNTPAMQRVIIQAEDVVMYYKNGTRYVLKVTDMNGNPLANENVTLTINGATYSRTTDENGTASIAINLSPGNYSASVSYVGTGNCTNSTIENSITVLSTIYGENLVKMFRNASQYYATFVDGQGNPLANGTEVTFNINGVMYKRLTNENGTARLNINLAPGTYILTATHPDNGQQYSNNITVISNIANNTDLVKYYKNDSQYVVTVIGADGKVVGAGENVTFNINGVMYTRQTNASGQAKLNINLGPGNYTITAMYGECMASNHIEVLPILYANDLVKKYGTSDQFRALLLDGQGKPFAGENVTFNINGVFYQRTTDADGYAALNIRLGAAVDEYIITSSYNGTSISNKIIVEP